MSDLSTVTKNRIDFTRTYKDQRFLLLIIIVLISFIVGSINPRFFGISNIMAIFQQISVLGMLTMGMALLLISGGIDLSIGMIMALSGVIMAKILMGGGNLVAAIAAGVGVATVCGLLNGIIVAKSKCIPLIISLGMSSVYFGISLVITGGKFMNFKRVFEWLRQTKIAGIIPFTLIFLIIMIAVTYVLLNRTKFGRRIVAIGGNEENAYLSGINVDFFKVITYTLSGFYCGVASIVHASRLDSIVSTAGQGYELSALTAAIIGGVTFEGGRGSVGGAFLGVIMIGLISNAMTVLNIHSYVQEIVKGVIIVIAVILSNINRLRKK